MREFIEFAILGLAVGGLYGLLSSGLIVIYRGSGVLNIAQGGFAYFGATLYYVFRDDVHTPEAFAVIFAILAGMALGVVTNQLIMRPMRRSSPLARLIATLGLMVFLESFIDWRLGENFHIIKGFLPSSPLKVTDGITVGTDRVIILGFSIVFTLVLAVVYSRTRFGLITSAVAANEQASASLGHSPNLIANINWAIGGGIGALTGVLLAPILGIAPNSMTLLIVPALAAALLGGFSSFTYVLLAAFAIGIAQSELGYYEPSVLGLSYALPFAFIVLIPFFRGQAIPGRGITTISLPSVGAGGFRWKWALPITVIAALVSLTLTTKWQTAFSISCVGMILALSVVVITGYAGQLSLCQFTLAGFAAWVTGQASIDIGLPFTAALIIGPLAVMPVGLLVGIPALRTRGISLAVATLGFAVVAENMIFANGSLTGGLGGTDVGKISLFGWSVYPVSHPWRYAMITLAGALLCGFLVSTVRNSPTGRRLLAVRSNERAAASLGIGVTSTKLYAFVLSSGIAGLGGVLFAYSNPNITYPTFSSLNSITLVLFVVLAGIGYASGGILAGVIFTGGIVGEVAIVLFHSSEVYQAIAAFFLVINLVLNPDGLIKIQISQINWVRRHWPDALRFGARPELGADTQTALAADPVVSRPSMPVSTPVAAMAAAPGEVVLEVSDLTVRFGGVTALADLSFSIGRGEVVGLIGANGAGKSTLIDAVSGFVPRYAGQVRLGGAAMNPLNAAQRARLGIRRTFQSLELFEDMTVFENIVTSCEPAPLSGYLKDLVAPPVAVLTDEAQLVSAQFGLGGDIQKRPPELSYGARRVAAIARAVAAPSRLLLLDEPTAGLDAEDSARLGQLVRDFAAQSQAAVLLVEHDVDLVMGVCDRVIVLDFGRKIAEGSPREVAGLQVVQDAYLGQDLSDEGAETDISEAAATSGGGGGR